MVWPSTERIESEGFFLDPLSVDRAAEMVTVLAAPSLYQFMGGVPPTFEELQRRYAAQCAGQSKDGSQWWLNWVLRPKRSGQLIGFVQATAHRDAEGFSADISWVVAPESQGRGAAIEAARAMVGWLQQHEVTRFTAFIHPQHHASIAVVTKLGLMPTDRIKDGEIGWEARRVGSDLDVDCAVIRYPKPRRKSGLPQVPVRVGERMVDRFLVVEVERQCNPAIVGWWLGGDTDIRRQIRIPVEAEPGSRSAKPGDAFRCTTALLPSECSVKRDARLEARDAESDDGEVRGDTHTVILTGSTDNEKSGREFHGHWAVRPPRRVQR